MGKPKTTILPLLSLFFGILAVSSASILIRFAQKNVPSLTIAVYRMNIAAVLLAPIALSRYRKEIIQLDRKEMRLICLSGLFLALHFASWITSLELTSVIISVVLVTTTPIWVAISSTIIFKEKIRLPVLLALMLVITGGFLVSGIQFQGIMPGARDFSELFLPESDLTGSLLALFGALCASGYLLTGRQLRKNMAVIPYTFLVYSSAAIILIIISLFNRQQLVSFSISDYGLLIALAIIPQLLGHSIFNWALAYLSATYVSMALLGEPVGTTLLAYFILDEHPSSIEILGGVVILIGLIIASAAERQKNNQGFTST